MDKKTDKFSLLARLRSFKYAFNGFKLLLKDEHNARLHLFFALLAIIWGFLLKISSEEWCFIVFAIGFVFVAEILNTCIEELCNFISPQQDSRIKKIKDLAASAVLISAATAVVVGLVIFVPLIARLVSF